jgi:hypothetical protein
MARQSGTSTGGHGLAGWSAQRERLEVVVAKPPPGELGGTRVTAPSDKRARGRRASKPSVRPAGDLVRSLHAVASTTPRRSRLLALRRPGSSFRAHSARRRVSASLARSGRASSVSARGVEALASLDGSRAHAHGVPRLAPIVQSERLPTASGTPAPVRKRGSDWTVPPGMLDRLSRVGRSSLLAVDLTRSGARCGYRAPAGYGRSRWRRGVSGERAPAGADSWWRLPPWAPLGCGS